MHPATTSAVINPKLEFQFLLACSINSYYLRMQSAVIDHIKTETENGRPIATFPAAMI